MTVAKHILSIAFLCVLLGSPARAQTFADYDTKLDFSKYQTYAWIAPGDSVLNRVRRDKLYGGFIMHAANEEIQKLGMAVDTLRPDALFVFETVLKEEVQYSQSPTLSLGIGVGGPGYYVGGSAPVAGGKITESRYHKGSLVYSMYDTRTGNLLLRAVTSKKLDERTDVQTVITESTKKIFKKYPKRKKK